MPCLCGRCGAKHTKGKRVVRLAIANETQADFFCTRSCSSLRQRDGSWEIREGVEGRVCKTCGNWTPKTKMWNRRGWKCNICAAKHPRFRWRTCRKRAKDADIPFDLSFDAFMVHWQKPCRYCGSDIETIGLDRTDNAVGYKASNVVPCCRRCNWMKGEDTVEVFIARCIRVAQAC